jgi:hypothetical protein
VCGQAGTSSLWTAFNVSGYGAQFSPHAFRSTALTLLRERGFDDRALNCLSPMLIGTRAALPTTIPVMPVIGRVEQPSRVYPTIQCRGLLSGGEGKRPP